MKKKGNEKADSTVKKVTALRSFDFDLTSSYDHEQQRPTLSEVPEKIRVSTKRVKQIVPSSSQLISGTRRKNPFSAEEKATIRTGVKKFGRGSWTEIKEYYDVILKNRTTIQIKYRIVIERWKEK